MYWHRIRGLSIDPGDNRCAAISQVIVNNGGAERDRTVDPLLAKQVLSQLSYSPMMKVGGPG